MRFKFQFKKQDAWIGAYWDSKTIYICFIPFFPLLIRRVTICSYCNKPIKGNYSGFGYHNTVKNQRYSSYTNELVTCWEAKKIDDVVDEECS